MHALVFDRFGGPEVLERGHGPVLRPRHALVRPGLSGEPAAPGKVLLIS
jgi:hypothetical protein